MPRRPRRVLACLAVVACLVGAAGAAATSAPAEASDRASFQVLVFSRTEGYRHASIPQGIEAVRTLGDEHGFDVDATEDPRVFRRHRLARYEAVVFLNTTGDVLNRGQQRALRRYVGEGGGFAGVHSAADTEHRWRYYRRLVGAEFKNHPLEQVGTFVNEARRHPATAHLDRRFRVFDEFYSYRTNPRGSTHVLLSIDESSYLADPNTSNMPADTQGNLNPEPYPGETGYMGDHPMSWCHRNLGGTAFYTNLGHEGYLYSLGWYRRHLLGGIMVAAGQVRADCSAG